MPFWGARARIACAATAALSLGNTSRPFSGSLRSPWETLCQANKTIAPARVARRVSGRDQAALIHMILAGRSPIVPAAREKVAWTKSQTTKPIRMAVAGPGP